MKITEQYKELRKKIEDNEILLIKIGDFYEAFFDDAKTFASLMNVALTKRGGIPMSGWPCHAEIQMLKKAKETNQILVLTESGKIIQRFEPNHPFENAQVLFKEESTVQKGKVVGTGFPNEYGHPLDIQIELESGEIRQIGIQEKTTAILVQPEKQSTFWKDILKQTPKDAVAECYESYDRPEATTLVCTKTLNRLKYEIHNVESGEVNLQKGDSIPFEGKPDLDDSYTIYTVGEHTIDLMDEHGNRQVNDY